MSKRNKNLPPPENLDLPLISEEVIGNSIAKTRTLETFLHAITRNTNFQEFVQDILFAIQEVIPSEASSIFELNLNGQFLFFRAALGHQVDQLFHFKLPLGQGIVGYVAESKSALCIDHLEENKAHIKSIGKTVGFEAKNLIACPIFIRTKIYGVIELLNRVGENKYSNLDLELLQYLCEYAGKAIEIRMMINWVKEARKTSTYDST